MKHRVQGRKLGRTSSHRLAVLRNLSTSLFRHERITTTLMKAKELRPFAERLITLSKRETLHARRLVLRDIHDKDVVSKMFDALSSRYAQRPGGYTRIIKLGPRRGDNAEIARIELVDAEIVKKAAEPEAKVKPEKKAKPAKPAPDKEASGKKGRAKSATPRTESKGKAKGAAATRKVGKSGS
ncbi:MAG TPA: 50S ribosomal protein L17 [Candidatus Polarisedimenticolaceae bacterium]|nr:50S ribosomal protein L17 [Candidatus Polarisedimenticolaceae bacterium]